MKVDKVLVLELKKEVNFQISRIRREIQNHGASDGRLQSMFRLIKLKQLLNGLLTDGELVLHVPIHEISDDGSKGGVLMKLSRFFRMVNEDEINEIR